MLDVIIPHIALHYDHETGGNLRIGKSRNVTEWVIQQKQESVADYKCSYIIRNLYHSRGDIVFWNFAGWGLKGLHNLQFWTVLRVALNDRPKKDSMLIWMLKWEKNQISKMFHQFSGQFSRQRLHTHNKLWYPRANHLITSWGQFHAIHISRESNKTMQPLHFVNKTYRGQLRNIQ